MSIIYNITWSYRASNQSPIIVGGTVDAQSVPAEKVGKTTLEFNGPRHQDFTTELLNLKPVPQLPFQPTFEFLASGLSLVNPDGRLTIRNYNNTWVSVWPPVIPPVQPPVIPPVEPPVIPPGQSYTATISTSANSVTVGGTFTIRGVVFDYGSFITAVINFLIMAFVLFLLVKAMNKMMSLGKKKEEPAPTTKDCPYCFSKISVKATRCPFCTTELVDKK